MRDSRGLIKAWARGDDDPVMVPENGESRVLEEEATTLGVAGAAMVTLTEGNLNHFTIQAVSPELRAIILAKAAESCQHLILDISEVKIIDSSGVGALVAMHGFAKQNGMTLHLCGADPKVARILRIMQLHRVMSMHATKDSALQACAEGGDN